MFYFLASNYPGKRSLLGSIVSRADKCYAKQIYFYLFL